MRPYGRWVRHGLPMTLWLVVFGWLLGPVPARPLGAQAQSTQVAIILELEEPPVTAIYAALQQRGQVNAAALTHATQAHLARIETAQQRVLGQLNLYDATLLYRNQRVYNGIALRVAPEHIAALQTVAGVKAVHRLVAKEPSNLRSVPSTGAALLWQGVRGQALTGAGRTIAIIDTGIDYLHTDFGGPGVGYLENDPTIIGDVPGFPGIKIIGGYDFTGDAYNADPDSASYNPMVTPDPDPMDCYPHGTSVAGTAAGYGVQRDGSTYTGPYTADLSTADLRIGPGVAPLAQLYALKVFGCTGSSEVVDQAIEWAVDPNGDGDLSDRVDVINLSLGSPYGSTHDMTAIAAENAALAGVIVVAAAGNSGDTAYVTGSPAVADHVISVAASQFLEGDPAGQFNTVPSFSSRGPRRGDAVLKPDLAAPGYSIVTAGQGSGSGSRTTLGTSLAAPHVAGALALLRTQYPDWSPLMLKALVMNSAATQLRTNIPLTATLYAPMRIGAGRLDLTRAISATALVFNADDPGVVSLSFGSPEVVVQSQQSKNLRVVNLQPRPATWTLTYMPITDAPGVTITLPVTTVQVAANSETTVTVMLTADASAMTRQRDPALNNTQAGQPRHWLNEESGYVLLWPTGPFTVSLTSTGAPPAAGAIIWSYAPQTGQLSYHLTSPALSAPVSGITLARGAASAYELPLPMTPLTGSLSLTGTVQLTPGDAHLLSEGWLTMVVKTMAQPTGALRGVLALPVPVLKTPLYAAPRPAATLRTSPGSLDFGSVAQATQPLTLTGVALTSGQPPTGVISLVSAVEWQIASPRLSTDVRHLARYGFADLQYAGVTSDFVAAPGTSQGVNNLAMTTLAFAVTTYEPWSTPNEVSIEIVIDVDQDGVDDYVLFNSDQTRYLSDQGTTDVFISALRDLRTGAVTKQAPLNGISPAAYDTALYNSQAMILPVRASALGLTTNRTTIRYRVESYGVEVPRLPDGARQLVDQTPTATFDVVAPGLTVHGVGNTLTFHGQPGASLTVTFQRLAYVLNGSQGLLLVHHHNERRARVEVLPVRYGWPHLLHLPLVARE